MKQVFLIVIAVLIPAFGVTACSKGKSAAALEPRLSLNSLMANAAAPSFSHESGTYDTDITVTLTSHGMFSTIYYTLDGSDPFIDSMKYTEPISVESQGTSITIRAVSSGMGGMSSTVTATYRIDKIKCAAPVFSPDNGYSEQPRTVTISSTIGSTIRYTLDGSDPRTSATAVTGSRVRVNSLATIRAYGFKAGLEDSDVSSMVMNVVKNLGYPFDDYIDGTGIALLSDNRPVVLVIYDKGYSNAKAEVFMLAADNHWNTLGTFNTGNAVIRVGTDDRPVIFYTDSDNGGNPRVKKWVLGTEWSDLGVPGISGFDEGSVAIGPDNKPVMASSRIMSKWNSGTTWTDMTFDSLYGCRDVSLAIGPDNKPVIIFINDGIIRSPYIIKWENNTWADLGTIVSDEPLLCRIAIGPDNRPVVLYTEESGMTARVMKWVAGTTWTDMGFTAPNVYSCTLAVDSNNIPLVAYSRLMKWSAGNTWSDLGTIGYEAVEHPSVAIGTDTVPVFVFEDHYHDYRTHVIRYNF